MNAAIADLLDGTHDVLLTRGRSGNYQSKDGRVCILRALGLAATDHNISVDVMQAAIPVLSERSGGNIVSFNYRATDDEVFDFLRNTAKELREEAGA